MEPLRISLLGTPLVSGRSEEEIAAALEELTIRGLLAESEHDYDFTHERLRTTAEERVGRARRRLLHRRAAEALSARHGDPNGAGRLEAQARSRAR